MASGSEVELIYQAADLLAQDGIQARLVSMPCMELFEEQDAAYKASVLPLDVRARVAVEAGVSQGWGKYVGLDGKYVCMDRFGASGPQEQLFKAYGFTPERIAQEALSVIQAQK